MLYSIWLQKVLGYSNPKIVPLIEKFGSAQGVYEAGINSIKPYLSSACQRRAEAITLEDCRGIANRCIKEGISVIPYKTALYPKRLYEIPDPPAVLYVKGNLPDIDSAPAICIVGSRKCDSFAEKSAFSLAYRLAKGGFAVVSGGALGADSFAHMGTVKAGGITVCVMPCGVNVNYPKANSELRKAIVKNGCLISEFMPDERVNRCNFAVRNRLLSGLSLGVAVVCAGDKSGTMLTVNSALEQGRDVFAVPVKNEDASLYGGNKRLLDEGAIPLVSAVKVFELYYPLFSDKIDMHRAYNIKRGSMYEEYEKVSADAEKEVNEPVCKNDIIEETPVRDISVLSDSAQRIYSQFSDLNITVDDISVQGVSPSAVFAALSELEMFGFIEALPGGYFKKI